MRHLLTSLLRRDSALPPPDPTATVRYPRYYVACWTAEYGKRLREYAAEQPGRSATLREA